VSTRDKEETTDWRWRRFGGILLLGLLILRLDIHWTNLSASRTTIPSSTFIQAEWRCGPFLFFPAFFSPVVGFVTASIAWTVWCIARRNSFEVVGWTLLGLVALLFAVERFG